MDAVAGIQLRRGAPHMLGCRLNSETNSAVWNGYPIQVDTAHFGLTVINAKKLATVEKPWFFCKPDEEGRWSDKKIDSDVWFWLQFAKAGLKVFIDPDCRLGHVEEIVAIYDENYKPTHMYPKEWIMHDVDTTFEDVEDTATGIACGSDLGSG
jgi:hypothetical protein